MDCLLSPHWLVIVLCVLGYILCFFLGAASATASLYRMVSHKRLRRSHWSTILLLTISVFVMLVVVPLELTRTTMHFFNTVSNAVCDVQLFCVLLSEVLAFSSTVAIAIGRVRKIHSPFQPKVQDLPERIAVCLCLIIAIPLAAVFIYLGHMDSDTHFTYQYCLMASSKQSSPISVKMRTFLNLLLPVSFFIVLVSLICVYMKGVWYIRKRTSITACPLQSSSFSMLTASPCTSFNQTGQKLPRQTTTHTFFTTSQSSTLSGNAERPWKNSIFLMPRESLSSTGYRLSTSSSFTSCSNPYSSSSQSTSPHQQFNLTELMPKSSDASSKQFTDSSKDSVPSRSALRKARKTQYSISKALRKASTVSMVSIDTIPEMSISMTEEQPKLLHPLRHTRRSASNMWHSAVTEVTPETTVYQSCQFKHKRKMKKSKSQQSGCSIASSTGSNPHTSLDFNDSPSSHPMMLQTHKRKMSQNSRGSMVSNSTHISTDLEMQNIDLDHSDTENLYAAGQTDKCIKQIDEEPPEHSDVKTEEKRRRLYSTSSSKLSQSSQISFMPSSPKESQDYVPPFDLETYIPAQQATSEAFCEKTGVNIRAGDISPTLSRDSVINRPPLPPISGTIKTQDSQRDHFAFPILQTLENELPIQGVIQTWGRCPPSKRHLSRSQSLINFYPCNQPAVYEFDGASASQPASELRPCADKTYVNSATQTDDTICDQASDNIDIIKEEPETDREPKKQQPQYPQKPKIRIIRPSLPHQQMQRESLAFDSRRILRNNWCSNVQSESSSSSVHFNPSPNLSRDSRKYDRTNSSLHRGSLLSEKSVFIHRNDNNTWRVFKRSLLLIAAFLFCFLPSSIVHMSASLMDPGVLVNIYALSRMTECIYFMFVPFLYVYTNASLMKVINRKPQTNTRE